MSSPSHSAVDGADFTVVFANIHASRLRLCPVAAPTAPIHPRPPTAPIGFRPLVRAGARPRPTGTSHQTGPTAGALVAVTMWGLAPVATMAAVSHLAPIPLLVIRLALAAVVLLPWAMPVFRSLSPRSAGRLLAAAGMLLWNRAVLSIGSTRASLLLYLEPAVSVLGALVLLHERLTPATIAGGLLIPADVATALSRQPA